jgi:formylglycine-generating enzyme required for sulfatase activity
MELVLIPEGRFGMGSPKSERGRGDDEVPVSVSVSKPFYLGITEVTQGQWRTLMGTSPWKGRDYVRDGDGYPATFVSWNDAQVFCKNLSEKEGTTYRLPTEAEWEYACRAGSTGKFSFGDDPTTLRDYCWYGGLVGNGNAKGEPFAHEVARLKPNAFGLYDMHGNVWEWCEDAYSEKLPGGADPQTSEGPLRVYRGGSWMIGAHFCRSAIRGCSDPSGFSSQLGFRVVREAAGK